jgi:hypothetical protein
MSDKQPTTNSTMPDRLYGEHYPDSFLDVSRPVREPNVATLGDYIRHLQEVDKQSNKPCVACEPVESSFEHICPNNPILTCNCTDPKFCAELGNDPDRQYRDVPDADNDGFADNIDYTGIPIPAPKRQDTLVGWPCVIVGAFSETWTTAAECVSGSEHSAGHTEQRTDAGLDNDGPVATTKL